MENEFIRKYKIGGKIKFDYRCESCSNIFTVTDLTWYSKKTMLCESCYYKSPIKSKKAKESVKKRRSYNGKNNPNYRGRIKITCPCGKIFERRI